METRPGHEALSAPPGGSVTVMLAGDVMTGRGIDQVLAHPSGPRLMESHVRDARDYVRLAEGVNGPIRAPVAADYIWGEALAQIERAAPDVRIVNLETAVTLSEDAWPGKGIHYRMNPANIGCLTAARIDACALANNHVLDWGRSGLLQTLLSLRQAGLRTAGAGADAPQAWAPAVLPLTATRRRLLLFSCATCSSGVPAGWAAGSHLPGVALLPDLSRASADRLAERVAGQRAAGDRVVVSLHWGGNWGLDVPDEHRDFAHRLIDLGAADIVHGHSSHHPMPIEVYRGRPILYGCGDLINDYEGIGPHGPLRSDLGCLYFVSMGADAQGIAASAGERSAGLLQLHILPLQLRRFRLVAADPPSRAWLESVFNQGGCHVGAPLDDRLPASWSLRWGAGG